MRVLVCGTGAMASLVGARLARLDAGPVTLAGTWAEGLAAVEAEGIAVEEAGERWRARPAVARLGGRLPVADLALVLAKSWQTAAVAPHVARALAEGGAALTLQNGLGNVEALAEVLGPGRVMGGVTSLGAMLLGPGVVRVTGDGPTVIGDTACVVSPAAVARLLGRAGVATRVTAGFEKVAWRKLAVNCAINPVSALLGLANGRLLERADARTAMRAAAREVAAVAAAGGLDIGRRPEATVYAVARATAGNRSSMLRDVERGAVTEIEAINGAVVRRGRALGVPTGTNEWLWRAVAGGARDESGRPAGLAGCPCGSGRSVAGAERGG